MSVQFTSSVRDSMLSALITAAGANAHIRIYSGTKPANADTALSGNTLLADITCGATFATTSGGTLTLSGTPLSDTSADNTGTASFFRVLKSDLTTVVYQGDVGTSGSDLNLNTTSIAAGGPVQINSWTLSIPA